MCRQLAYYTLNLFSYTYSNFYRYPFFDKTLEKPDPSDTLMHHQTTNGNEKSGKLLFDPKKDTTNFGHAEVNYNGDLVSINGKFSNSGNYYGDLAIRDLKVRAVKFGNEK